MTGKLNGVMPGDHAQRLAQRVAVNAGSDVLGDLALQKMRRADGELDHLQAARHLALGVVMGLAVLGRDHLGELVSALPEDGLEPIEDAGPAQRRGLGPGWPGRGGGSDGPIDLGGRGERHGLFGLAGGGIVDWL